MKEAPADGVSIIERWCALVEVVMTERCAVLLIPVPEVRFFMVAPWAMPVGVSATCADPCRILCGIFFVKL